MSQIVKEDFPCCTDGFRKPNQITQNFSSLGLAVLEESGTKNEQIYTHTQTSYYFRGRMTFAFVVIPVCI